MNLTTFSVHNIHTHEAPLPLFPITSSAYTKCDFALLMFIFESFYLYIIALSNVAQVNHLLIACTLTMHFYSFGHPAQFRVFI